MAELRYNLHELYYLEMGYSQLRSNAQIMAGSLMIGSSIAYPMLAKDASLWAPVSLAIFSVSWVLFNALQVGQILKFGRYTVAAGCAGLIIVLTLGKTSPADHIPFIPVYAMAASFLTCVWPSLGEAWATYHDYDPLPGVDESRPGTHLNSDTLPHMSLSTIRVDDHQNGVYVRRSDQATPRASVSSWVHGQNNQRPFSPFPYSLPPSLDGDSQAGQSSVLPHELQYMGPRSAPSGTIGPHSDTIALSSRASMPSEASDNVIPLLRTAGDMDISPRQTQRRLDIAALPTLGRSHEFT